MSWRTSRSTFMRLCLASLLSLFVFELPMRVLAQQSMLKIGSGEPDFLSLSVREQNLVSNQQIHNQSFTKKGTGNREQGREELSEVFSIKNSKSETLTSISGLLGLRFKSPAQAALFPVPGSRFPINRQSSQELAPSILQAQAPTPKSKPPRLPGRREPAAGRGCGVTMPKPPLTALIPNTTFGLTAATHPTFFFYIPQTSATAVRFVLLDEENQNKLYDKTFAIPRTSGVVSLSLSADKTLQPLEVGKNYRWYFLMICDPQERSADIYVEGLVQPVELTPNLSSQLKKASPLDRVALYQKNQLWYDALTTLAEQRRLNAEDAALQAEWENLLRSQGLDAIARESLVGSFLNKGF